MNYLWIDNLREASKNWDWARSIWEALDLLKDNRYETISIDSNLVDSANGMIFILYIIENEYWPEKELLFHSSCPTPTPLVFDYAVKYKPEHVTIASVSLSDILKRNLER